MAVYVRRTPMNPDVFGAWFKAQWIAPIVGAVSFIALAIADAEALVWAVVVPAVVVFIASNSVCRLYYPNPTVCRASSGGTSSRGAHPVDTWAGKTTRLNVWASEIP